MSATAGYGSASSLRGARTEARRPIARRSRHHECAGLPNRVDQVTQGSRPKRSSFQSTRVLPGWIVRWRNVDLDRAALRIVESLAQTKSGLRFKSPKTDHARAAALPNFAIEELRRLKREEAESLLMLGVRQTGDTLVCGRRDGEPLQPKRLTHEFPTVTTTLDHYSHVTATMQQDAAGRLDVAFRGAMMGLAERK